MFSHSYFFASLQAEVQELLSRNTRLFQFFVSVQQDYRAVLGALNISYHTQTFTNNVLNRREIISAILHG